MKTGGQAAPDESCVADLPEIAFLTDVRIAPGVTRAVSRALAGTATPLLAGLGIPLLIMLTGAAGWPAAALVARARRQSRPQRTHFERWARRGAA